MENKTDVKKSLKLMALELFAEAKSQGLIISNITFEKNSYLSILRDEDVLDVKIDADLN